MYLFVFIAKWLEPEAFSYRVVSVVFSFVNG